MPHPVPFPTADETVPGALARLRGIAPVVPVELPGGVVVWAVLTHEAVKEVLGNENKTFGKDKKHWPALHDGTIAEDWPMRALIQGNHINNVDGADHRRLRDYFGSAFSPRMIAELEPRVRGIVKELLDCVAEGDNEVDLVALFTDQVPMQVICELYGVAEDERPALSRHAMTVLSYASAPEAVRSAHLRLLALLDRLVDQKRKEPGDDLTSALVHARRGDDRLSQTELVDLLRLTLLAGHETTAHLLANSIISLCTHRDQLELAVKDDLWPRVVEESLRVDSPVQASPFRFSLKDTTVCGVEIPAGEALLICFGSAGTDPNQYGPTADQFDITRPQRPHLSFAYGPHFCAGAPLARLEGRIALAELFGRFPEMELAVAVEDIPYRPNFVTYGPAAVQVRLNRD
ncbi:cytochrome P450 family protein [Allokutzneria albata]|uniref:Cytochrome P450 n=1 Tax=Allokutzneria albata TaxID=211114 RepID=A0A1H0BCX2_ALLAB|nr:cytochrome P450 [Allokutzneria albata]SDN43468.1 Cytochrome P450 [Allokutzneria albata]